MRRSAPSHVGLAVCMRLGASHLPAPSAAEFFEAFTAYDKQGDKKGAFICLKFLVVANIISNSDIDPFAPNETRVYLGSSPEIDAINEFEPLAEVREDAPTAIALLD